MKCHWHIYSFFSQPESAQAAFDQRFETECDFLPPKVNTRLSHICYGLLFISHSLISERIISECIISECIIVCFTC